MCLGLGERNFASFRPNKEIKRTAAKDGFGVIAGLPLAKQLKRVF